MKENKISIEINRPVSEVFEFVLNPKNTPLWIDNIVHEETNEFPARRGTKYKNKNRKGEWAEYDIVQFNLNKTFTMKQKNSFYSVRYILEAISKTKTKLTYFEWADEGELDGPFSIEVLEKLKKLVEAN
jgi:uncharacterized protein YndB with AHSA1/START domain